MCGVRIHGCDTFSYSISFYAAQQMKSRVYRHDTAEGICGGVVGRQIMPREFTRYLRQRSRKTFRRIFRRGNIFPGISYPRDAYRPTVRRYADGSSALNSALDTGRGPINRDFSFFNFEPICKLSWKYERADLSKVLRSSYI